MSIAVQVLPGIQVIQIAVDGDSVFLRRDKCTEFLSAFMLAMADSIPAPGDASDGASAETHEAGPAAAPAGAGNNVVDLHRWSWKVEGSAS